MDVFYIHERIYNTIIFISDTMEKNHSLKLSTGDQMPLVGLGTWKIPKEKCP